MVSEVLQDLICNCQVGNSAQSTVYATCKRSLAWNFALRKQVNSVEAFTQWLSISKRKMIHRMCYITEKDLAG